MRIRITAGGIYGGDGELAIGTDGAQGGKKVWR